ncbi:isoaspartyl peptidase/L-asparaginase [Bifidobacterium mellis]|uniref:isoaspartyl peptidase/L-asparaginase n=1 Tax=Bifidobacterium mellis TaxID=1293823 RepID=UPI001E4B2FAE|nr:isoaspartyl peptidase/L-asparaginase [Bifidobacterium mellis]
MAYESMVKSSSSLEKGGWARDAVEVLIQEIEPNPEGMMEVDAAFMDGNSMALVAVAGIQHVLHPPHIRGQIAELTPYK